MEFFAACPRGLEAALKDELLALGAHVTGTPPGGVNFEGDDSLVYKANLWSRIASRIMIRVVQGPYESEDDIYQLAVNFAWEDWFGAHKTLRIDTTAIRSPLKSLQFITLRVKDGIVDHFRDIRGERPSINTYSPDVRVFVFLDGLFANIYIDTSGEPLFKRGWRTAKEDKGAAPLKENLAAGLIALTGWNPESAIPVYDPFCGSGTIVIEAAQRALDMAPGISRRFGFEQLRGYDPQMWKDIKGDALQRFQTQRSVRSKLFICGSDVDPESIEQCHINVERAGLPKDIIEFKLGNALTAQSPFTQPGLIIANPPYGERIELIEGTFLELGARLRQEFGGWTVHLLTSDLKFSGTLGMREKRKTPLFNGALDCRLWGFEIFARKAALN
jgi:putative N6-adenine-specific DNA methylase